MKETTTKDEEQEVEEELQLISLGEDETNENLSEHEKSDSEQEKDCPTRPESEKSDSDTETKNLVVRDEPADTLELTSAATTVETVNGDALLAAAAVVHESVQSTSCQKSRRAVAERRSGVDKSGRRVALSTGQDDVTSGGEKSSRREKSAENKGPLVTAKAATSKPAGSITASGANTPAATAAVKRTFACTVKSTNAPPSATLAAAGGCKIGATTPVGRTSLTTVSTNSTAMTTSQTTAKGIVSRPRITRALTTIGTSTVARDKGLTRRSQVEFLPTLYCLSELIVP